ncbi:response regulator transcription factor [Pseudoteredinibacter isoporae]|uniref:DNA-binding NarL/FixJ family response regulator n=1 Tax=Pseudoteredinibacter isoporae TaxID=570281 RepID=A0A7X0JUC1_9GAMM|nr:response regulator transcription factor [Pseudoteredinibacter isoporae]MBB6522432.1 DNA-binding NarL/FixJ family response regulator [Pseudoteredinibacter isoporae]NHO87962.1 response regulator transcription factor [Pseudoteredinibacter isoporae]NIB23707.1 response regulator transcription factor [Pseudoteredinibacter isoporae]
MPKFIVADDHPLFRGALVQALEQHFTNADIVQAEDVESLQKQVQEHNDADLLLLDLHMPGASGFSGLIFINGQYPHIPVMVVSANEQASIIHQAIEYGAAGFLPKSSPPEMIGSSIEKVLQGEIWLPENLPPADEVNNDNKAAIAEVVASFTPQQFRVANMLADGLLNKQIAYEMDVTEATVKAHLTAIFRKLGVHSRTQAVLAMNQLDLSPPQMDS